MLFGSEEAARVRVWSWTSAEAGRQKNNKKDKMDDYMFKFFVDECRVVEEKTSYIEIFNYSVSCVLDVCSFRLR